MAEWIPVGSRNKQEMIHVLFIEEHAHPAICKWKKTIQKITQSNEKENKLVHQLGTTFAIMEDEILMWKDKHGLDYTLEEDPSPARPWNANYKTITEYAFAVLEVIGGWQYYSDIKRKEDNLKQWCPHPRQFMYSMETRIKAWKGHISETSGTTRDQQGNTRQLSPPQEPSGTIENQGRMAEPEVQSRERSQESLLRNAQTTIEQQTKEMGGLNKKITDLRWKLEDHKSEMDWKVNSLRQQLTDVKREKQEALTRLSELAGQKLRKDNPAITDLSTENRPTKLAEWYRELYDNQWTDAFAELTDDGFISDQEAIGVLFTTLTQSFGITKELSKAQMKELGKCTTTLACKVDETEDKGDQRQHPQPCPRGPLTQERHLPQARNKGPTGKMTVQPKELPDECTDLLKQLLKASSPVLVPAIQQVSMAAAEKSTERGKEMEKFIMQCAKVTWFMNVQTPPMVLDVDVSPGQPVPTNKYSLYTQDGDLVEYVVWPACLLHEDGPLLAKGIVQGVKSETEPTKHRKGQAGEAITT